MKIIVGLLIILLLCGFTNLSDKYPTIQSIAANVHGPAGLQKFFKNFTFTRSGSNNMREFLQTKEGDCDMFALVSYEVLKRWDLEPILVTLVKPDHNPRNRSHAICIFKTKGGVYIFSNGEISFGKNNAQAIAKKYNKNWTHVFIWQVINGRSKRRKDIVPGDKKYKFYPQMS